MGVEEDEESLGLASLSAPLEKLRGKNNAATLSLLSTLKKEKKFNFSAHQNNTSVVFQPIFPL